MSGVRVGLGFRIAPHVRAYVSAPLFGHGRRLAGHQGHAEGGFHDFCVGAFVLYVTVVTLWKLAVG